MKISKKIFPSLIACLLLTSCAGVSEISEPVVDLFSEENDGSAGNPFLTSDTQSTTDKSHAFGQYSSGDWSQKINDNKPVVYDGKPVTVKVSVSMNDKNKADWMPGIGCCINGVYQKLSGCGQKDVTRIVFDEIPPGESREYEITFDPVVREEDADKDELPMMFFTCSNAGYVATEDYPVYGFLRNNSPSPPYSIRLNSKPKTISPKISDEYTEELITKEVTDKYFTEMSYNPELQYQFVYQKDGTNKGVLELAEDGSLSFDFIILNYEQPGEYVVSVLNNHQHATFNSGKEYAELNIKKGHMYTIPIKPDEVRRGDTLQVIVVKKNHNNRFIMRSDEPHLVVRSGFEFSKEESDSMSETAAPETSTSKNSEPENTDPDALPIMQGCRLFGYYEQDGSRITLLSDTFGDNLYYYDADKEKVIKKVSAWDIGKCNFYGNFSTYDPSTEGTKELERIETESVKYDAMQITDNYFIVSKPSDETLAGYDYQVYDHDFKFIKKITNGVNGVNFLFTDDDRHIIKNQKKSDQSGDNFTEELYISDINGKNSKKLCELPLNMVFDNNKYTVINDGMLYALMHDNAALNNSLSTPIAIDLSTGQIITADFSVANSSGASQGIYCAGEYVLYITGKSVMDNNDPGYITIFDKKQKKFRQIKTANLNETNSCMLTPDGSKIIALSPNFDLSQNWKTDSSVRIYDTATGKLIKTVKDVPNEVESVIVCGSDKFTLPLKSGNRSYDIGG